MDKEFLLKLIEENEESEWIEFKSNYPAEKHYEEIGEYISAISNSAALKEQTYGYMIWGVEDSTKKIIGTTFEYDLNINGSEVFKHYLARNLQPSIALRFETFTIHDKRIVCLTIPAANKVITEFKRERFIRIGSSKETLRKYPEYEADLWATLTGSNDITIIPSRRKNLTFHYLKIYLSDHNFQYNDLTFEDNLHLRTPHGSYNLMAELLADENDISVNVATFATTDKTQYISRTEFGGRCLLDAMEKAKGYIETINPTYVDTRVRPRKEIKLFSPEAFKEAWYNACVHYKWAEMNNPGIYVYSDRLEIESYGGIPRGLTKRQFLNGVSHPVNKTLFEIFKICGFVEKSGHGVPTVVKTYGENAYRFEGNFINVIIPFEKINLKVTSEEPISSIDNNTTQENYSTTRETTQEMTNTTQENHSTTRETTQEMTNTTRENDDTTQENILNLLKENGHLNKKKLAELLHLTEDGVKYHIKELKKKSKLIHHGSTKAGYWEVKE